MGQKDNTHPEFDRNLYRSIIKNIPDLVWLKDPEGLYITCNDRFERFFGKAEKDIIGRSDYDFFSTEEAEFFRQKDREAIEANKPTTNIEWVTFADDGHRELLETIKTPMYDANGILTGVLGIARDITDRHRLEEELKAGEEKYKLLFENSPVPMWIYDLETLNFLAVNNMAIQHYGYSREEFLGSTLKDIRPPQDVPGLIDNILIHKAKSQKSGAWRHLKKNGEIILVNIISHEITFEGRHARFVLIDDVTEKLKTEEERRKLTTAIEQSPVSVMITDLTGNIEYVNPRFCKLTGYDSEEVIGRNPRFLKSGKTSPEEYAEMWQNISSGKEWRGEFRNVKKNGDLYIELATISPVFNEKRKITHFIALKEDITLIKQNEADLKNFKFGIENTTDSVFITDPEGIITYINPGFEKMYGYTKAEALGQTPRILKSGLVPMELYKQMWDTLLSGNPVKGEIKNRAKDGRIIEIEGSNTPIKDEKGKILGFLSINRDISERKRTELALRESEENYRKIFEKVQDVFYQTDTNGKVLNISPSVFNLSGYKAEELIGNSILMLYENAESRGQLLKVLAEKGEIYDYEVRLKTKSGEIRYGSVNAHLYHDSEGKLIGTEGTVRDINDRKKAEFELVEAKEKAEESNRLKSAFISNISHEIRTPMNSIIGFTALLSEPDNTPEIQANYIETLNNSANQLLSIINDIVDISSISARVMRKEKSIVDIKRVMRSLFDRFAPKAKEKNLSFDLRLTPDDDSMELITDGPKVTSICTNLILNAIKFTNEGGITIGYTIKDKVCEFFVNDTGIGIDSALQSRIFDTFFQVESSLARHYEGMGLGLSICKAYVELLGGEIWVESEIGKGSTFRFTVPLEKNVEKASPKPAQRITDHFPKTILIAEDDDNSFKLIETILASYSVKIIRATDGADAIKKCKDNRDIDLVIMDIKLPVIDGLEASRIIRKEKPNLTIIAQTAFLDDTRDALEAGCSDKLSKPFTAMELINIIRKNFLRKQQW